MHGNNVIRRGWFLGNDATGTIGGGGSRKVLVSALKFLMQDSQDRQLAAYRGGLFAN